MIPVSATELETYSPGSFANLEPKPTFRLRPATPRGKRRYSQALLEEGLRFHSDAAVEAEVIHAMRMLWAGDPDQLAANEARIRAFNETLRQAAKDPTVEVDPVEAQTILLSVAQLTDAWPMLRRMNADNARFNADAPKIALAQFLAGWSNVDLPFRLENGVVPLEVLDQLEETLDAIEARALADRVEGVTGAGFTELTLKALGLLGLDGSAEKNSASPSSQSDTPNGSTEGGSETTASEASAEQPSPPTTSDESTETPKSS